MIPASLPVTEEYALYRQFIAVRLRVLKPDVSATIREIKPRLLDNLKRGSAISLGKMRSTNDLARSLKNNPQNSREGGAAAMANFAFEKSTGYKAWNNWFRLRDAETRNRLPNEQF